MKPGEYLSHYATRYDIVEVDSTFYRLPTPFLCRRWAEMTPGHFRFSMKVTRSITHDRVLENCEEEWEKYLEAAGELGDRLGNILFQFGYFNRTSACPDLAAFLKRLEAFSRRCPDRHRYVVEIRNKNWLLPNLLSALKGMNFGLALVDQQWMPRPDPLWKRFGPDLLTSDVAYVRFLGERDRIERITKKWGEIVIDRGKETGEWIPVLREILARNVPVFAFFNNHYAGHGPASIELFRKAWEA
jgi:uncharacterized protein YecE (DUF72 family)